MFNTFNTLRATIKSQEARIAQLEKQIEEYISVDKADHQVDFFAMNAFSVERLAESPTTVIGWKPSENEHNEWHISCNLEVHERLCQEFKDYIIEKKLTQIR